MAPLLFVSIRNFLQFSLLFFQLLDHLVTETLLCLVYQSLTRILHVYVVSVNCFKISVPVTDYSTE